MVDKALGHYDKMSSLIFSLLNLSANFNMGGSASCIETEGGDVDEHSSSQTNLGIVNFESESLDKPKCNWLEVVTFILIIIAVLYCAKI